MFSVSSWITPSSTIRTGTPVAGLILREGPDGFHSSPFLLRRQAAWSLMVAMRRSEPSPEYDASSSSSMSTPWKVVSSLNLLRVVISVTVPMASSDASSAIGFSRLSIAPTSGSSRPALLSSRVTSLLVDGLPTDATFGELLLSAMFFGAPWVTCYLYLNRSGRQVIVLLFIVCC